MVPFSVGAKGSHPSAASGKGLWTHGDPLHSHVRITPTGQIPPMEFPHLHTLRIAPEHTFQNSEIMGFSLFISS